MGNMICKAIPKNETPSTTTQHDKRFSFGDEEIFSHQQKDIKLKSSNQERNSKQKIITNPTNKKDYHIIRICGKGYYSKVYMCKESKGTFAIKTLIIPKPNTITNNSNGTSNTDMTKGIKHLNQDNSILPSFSSQYIITLIEQFSLEDKQYIIYPYYNLDLFTLLKQVKVIPEKIIQVILLQVFCALSYLHDKNYIYRDLKPENIMIDISNGVIKLIDFGLAIYNENETIIHKEICGTSEYVPPEAIKGEGYNIDFDWWGFGIFAYELSNGRPPFLGKTQKDIFNAVLTEELSFNNDNCSDELVDLIGCLLKKDKRERITEENIPYHPFFRCVDYNSIKNAMVNEVMKNYVKKYKDFTNNVIDQPNNNRHNKDFNIH